jgi:hypothetical protein
MGNRKKLFLTDTIIIFEPILFNKKGNEYVSFYKQQRPKKCHRGIMYRDIMLGAAEAPPQKSAT